MSIFSGAGATIQRAEIESFHAKQTQRLGPMKMAGGHFGGGGSGGAGSSSGGGDIQAGYVLRPATSNVSIHPQDEILQSTSRSYTNLPYTHQVTVQLRRFLELCKTAIIVYQNIQKGFRIVDKF